MQTVQKTLRFNRFAFSAHIHNIDYYPYHQLIVVKTQNKFVSKQKFRISTALMYATVMLLCICHLNCRNGQVKLDRVNYICMYMYICVWNVLNCQLWRTFVVDISLEHRHLIKTVHGSVFDNNIIVESFHSSIFN